MAAVQTGIENFKAALQGVQPQEAFIPAASPGILAQGSRIRDEYYPTTDGFLEALAQAMRREYQAIV
jgi:5-methyltetrahydropteroyltriglutamate--homocysteine methyltransferase